MSEVSLGDDAGLVRSMKAHAAVMGPSATVSVRFSSAAELRRVAGIIEGHQGMLRTIEGQNAMIAAQGAVIDAQGAELTRQRWWALCFALLAGFSTILAVWP